VEQFLITEDGSHTVFSEKFGEHYHSLHGAIQESRHIFINAGLKACPTGDLRILEIGFGTGLNALLSYLESLEGSRVIDYVALEPYPLDLDKIAELNYAEELGSPEEFLIMHNSKWGEWIEITHSFNLKKIKGALRGEALEGPFDLIDFDAFSPQVQPELWTEQIFRKLAIVCAPGAILTTYSAKGDVRRALEAVGFEVERLPGPRGKREIIRATFVGVIR